MRYPKALFLVMAASCASGVTLAGDIYCNNQGKDCSDRWTPNSTVVHINASPSLSGNEAAPPASNAPPSGAANADAQLKEAATRQAVQKDVKASMAEQCKTAQEKYQKAINARRVYKLDQAGERVYLSDAEMEQARVAARQEVERTCGSAPDP